MHDIRNQIPLTDQTNPAKFPQYEKREYPKMMLDEKGKPYLNASKQPAIVQDEREEDRFKADHYKPDTSIPAAGSIASLANENEELVRLRAELAELRAAPVAEKKKPGRPAKVKVEPQVDESTDLG